MCAPGKRILTSDDMKDLEDVEVPKWKKKALSENLDPSAAPFGGNWNMESVVSASDKVESKKVKDVDMAHDHDHSPGE